MMNDNEKRLFRQALDAGPAPLPEDFARSVLDRIAREKARRERRAERWLLAIVGVLSAGAAGGTLLLLDRYGSLPHVDTEVWRSLGEQLAALFTQQILRSELVTMSVLVGVLYIPLWIAASRWLRQAAEK